MRRFLMMTAIAATTLGSAQLAQAEARPDGPPPVCRQDQKDCPKPQKAEQKKHRDDRAGRPGDDRRGPPPEMRAGRQEPRRDDQPGMAPRHLRVGDNGAAGTPFKPGKDMRLKEAPRGKEYRVIDDRLVLVNKKDHKIVEVLGLAPRLR
ncbi:hypothetical protein RGQ15_17580 [Paracoccus sp. MBLB3053]|uniref:RcnB family protein n=1 Tax=Paracoccus aurantius TaxID=3073814 RepID=A0ABU2HWE4_9RHOB|nr:hypothetical protein [Paracoccus sp. MBLB3053]MDS9469377.1 hypothetical protein [Paracoccus sp. MBLB3053]